MNNADLCIKQIEQVKRQVCDKYSSPHNNMELIGGIVAQAAKASGQLEHIDMQFVRIFAALDGNQNAAEVIEKLGYRAPRNKSNDAVERLRKVQLFTIDNNASPRSVCEKLDQCAEIVREASKEIKGLDGQINWFINALNQANLFSSDVIMAYCNGNKEEAQELEDALGAA